MANVRIAVADVHSLLRQAVEAVLERVEGLEVVGAAADHAGILELAAAVHPDVVILDHDLPPSGGVASVEELRSRVPDVHILLLSDSDDADLLVSALEAGADGFMSKASPLASLVGATMELYEGNTVVPRRMLGPLIERLLERRRDKNELRDKIALLTKREREVISVLASGASNETIASTLLISPETVRTHIQNILMKLEVHSRLEVSALVRRTSTLQIPLTDDC